jgi:hypothetical protein
MFEWASREGATYQARTTGNGEILESMIMEESFERHALLRHFLHRCVTKGLLTESELDLLIQFRLDGNNGDHPGGAAADETPARQTSPPGPVILQGHPNDTRCSVLSQNTDAFANPNGASRGVSPQKA